jgi:uncharacterized SAM-binding protein YcdF (DUF218 family)
MFWFRKMIARLVFPVPLVFEFILLGSLFLLFQRTKRAGRILIGTGITLLYFFSIPVVGDSLLGRLERQSHALNVAALSGSTHYVIGVVGNGLRHCESGCEGCFNDFFLVRLQEAGRICRNLESRSVPYELVVSVATEMPMEMKHDALINYFSSFSIPAERIHLVENALNSKMEVDAFSQWDGQLILVSNAFHLPRLMLLARDLNSTILAAPAGYKAPLKVGGFMGWIPSAEALNHTRFYVYEQLGMLFP